MANFQRKDNLYYLDCSNCTTRSVVYKEKLFGIARWRVVFKSPGEKVLISVLMNKRAAFQHARQLHTAWRRGVRNATVSG